ncbi:MAG: DnaJ domain-containing protein [Acidimicrobiia bacterium]
MAIRPPRDDLYGELGVVRGASTDELSAAFRRRAKELHPDARAADPAATEEFKRVSRAYAVLRDPVQRARYDAGIEVPRIDGRAPHGPWDASSRTDPRVPPVTARATAPRPAPRRWELSRRGALWAVGGGVALVVLGVLAGVAVVMLQQRDADLQARGVAVQAKVVEVGGRRRLQFTTRDGKVVVATESTKSGSVAPPLGSSVGIHYDRHDPSRIVADGSHVARNVTLWIVAVKFLVGGALLVWFGRRRLRR